MEPHGLKLAVVNDVETAVELVTQNGFTPIECSIGGTSIVDSLKMDHHGDLSHLEGVAIRAYRDHFGARKDRPRFVTPSPVDADAAFATAALLGVLPHPSRANDPDVLAMPKHLQELYTRDLTKLAETINEVDTNPIGLDVPSMPYGAELLTWQAMASSCRDHLGYYGAVSAWVSLMTTPEKVRVALMEGVHSAEQHRIEVARDDARAARKLGPIVAIDESRDWGFDIWYGRLPNTNPATLEGWVNPCVMARDAVGGHITVGCPNLHVAEALFGPGGLKNAFPLLEPAGWGGRETIGGSPRGLRTERKDLWAAQTALAKLAGHIS